MALETQVLDVPFRGGLAQGVAAEVVPAGAWLTLDNVIIEREGEIRKRPGFYADTQSGQFGTLHMVATHDARAELLLASHEAQYAAGRYTGTGMRLRARQEGRPWTDRGPLPAFEAARRPLVRSHRDLDQSCVQMAIGGSRRAVVWLAPNLEGGSALDVWLRVDDMTTGGVLWEERRISEPPAIGGIDDPETVTVLVSGNFFVVVWDTLGTGASTGFAWLRCRLLSTDLTSLNPIASLNPVNAPARGHLEWDACPIGTLAGQPTWVYCHVRDTGDLDLYSVETATSTPTYRYTKASVGVGISQPTVHAGNGQVGLAFIDDSAPAANLVTASTWTSLSYTGLLEAGGSWRRPVILLPQGDQTNFFFAYSGQSLADQEEVKYLVRLRSTGAPVSAIGWGRVLGQEIWSRPFEPFADGRVFLVTTSYVGTRRRQAGYQVIDTWHFTNRNNIPPGWHGSLARYGGKGQPPLKPVWVPVSVSVAAHLPVLVDSDETGVGQVDEALLRTRYADLPGVYRTAQAQGLSALTGSLTCLYDGEQVLSAGFAESPLILDAVPTYGAPPGLEGDAVNTNVYLYTAIYARRDAAGNVHVSEPSPVASVSISTSGGDVHATVELTIRCTSLLHGPEQSLDRYASDVYILLFRTKKNESGPFYQRVTSAQLKNATHQHTVTFVDSLDDAGLGALGYGFLYTDGGVLPSQPAPPSTGATVHENRLWLVDAEDRRRVWFSRELVPGEAPAFNEELTLRFDDSPDEITALGSLDTSLAVFTTTRIYLVDGEGPDDRGGGGSFSRRLLTTTSGCSDGRSLVRLETGLIYRDHGGLQLLARGGLPAPVGTPVQDTLDTWPRVRGSAHDPANRRCFWVVDETFDFTSRIVVYDYEHDAWATWSWALGEQQTGIAVWRNPVSLQSLVVSDPYQLFLQSSTGYDEGDTWITMRIRTPWLHVAAMGGYQRTRRMVILGERLTEHALRGALYTDHDGATVRDTWSWDLGASSTVAGLPQLALRAVLARQQARACAVELWDEAPAELDRAPSTGARLYGLAFEIGVKPGPARMAAANKR